MALNPQGLADVLVACAGLACLAGFTLWLPAAAAMLWILFTETSPDIWLAGLTGGYETIIGATKGAGILIAVAVGVRYGWRRDRYNPGFAYLVMFITGPAHGLYPGLTLLSSLRSLIGSAAPFAFGLVNLPGRFCRVVIRTVMLAPLFATGFGALLQALGEHAMYDIEQGSLRLGGAGQPPFLAGFALIAVYAGLLELVRAPRAGGILMLLVNFVILLATGARAPLALAVLLLVASLVLPSPGIPPLARILSLVFTAMLASLAVLFAASLAFIRVLGMFRLGQATALSNRSLVWPYFEAAFARSPWVGWGLGAGKYVLPTTGSFTTAIGTNAAHNEYLRLGVEGGVFGVSLLIISIALWVWRATAILPPAQRRLMRLVFLAFAAHSLTDNTLIATTASVFFIWAYAVFATPRDTAKPAS